MEKQERKLQRKVKFMCESLKRSGGKLHKFNFIKNRAPELSEFIYMYACAVERFDAYDLSLLKRDFSNWCDFAGL